MTTPRSSQVHLDTTPYYHCMSRCVRQAYLLGADRSDGRFDHRKQWIVDELAALTRVFAIDVCAYAVMSNHLHLVLRLDADRATSWSDDEVVQRTGWLFPHAVGTLESEAAAKRAVTYRERLSSLSWFMRCLNERIARRANREDGCRGRFWEGRFKCRPLLDIGAVLTCMAYVDLNPTRAGLAETLAEADFTSIQQRLAEVGRSSLDSARGVAADHAVDCDESSVLDSRRLRAGQPTLLPFADGRGARAQAAGSHIPFEGSAYVDLVRSLGAAVHPEKRGRLTEAALALLRTVGLAPGAWPRSVEAIETLRFAAIGERHLIEVDAQRRGVVRATNGGWADAAYLRNQASPSDARSDASQRRAA